MTPSPSQRFALAALLCLAGAQAAAAEAKRPNILFLFADDWGRYASVYAQVNGPGGVNDVLQTPHFDRLARQGVLFRNAHVCAPSCTPCRSALLSGQYFWRTGRASILQGALWDAAIPSYPLLLKDAGYHIGKSYKVWSPGSPVDAPYGGNLYAYEKAGRRFNKFSTFVTQMVQQGMSVEAAKQAIYDEVKANFQAFLADRKPGQPWCYWFGPTNTHRKWMKGSGKALWGLNPDALKGKMPPFLPDVPEVREDLVDYFGEALAVDASLGLLMEELRKTGEFDNTLIVVSGDHGAPGFPHGKCNLYEFGTGVSLAIAGPGVRGGRVVDDFVNLTDLAPTFLDAGAAAVPKVMTGRSLWPVLKSDKQGLVDPKRTWVVTGRERHVAMAREGGLPYPHRSFRTAEYRLIINFKPDRYPMGDPDNLVGLKPPTQEELTENTFATFADMDSSPTKAWLVGQRNNPQWKRCYDLAFAQRPREELYDLKKDPHEANNVAADPAYAQVRADLERRLVDELRRTGDPRVIDDGRFFETPPMAGPLSNDARPQPAIKGQRVFTCAHSFHAFAYRMLAEMAKGAGIQDHESAGFSGIGGSRVIQHWDVAEEKNEAKAALRAGKVDVLTLSPIWMPDEGIEKFAKLGLEHNGAIRVTVQEFWLPNDTYEPIYPLQTRKKVDHNATSVAELRKQQARYDHDLGEFVRGVNKRLGKDVALVVPVGQAANALRERIVAGTAPGLKAQADLFRDNWGHPQPPLQVLAAYCHYAVIYRRSPVGLPVPAVLAKLNNLDEKDKLNRLLQELAWDAVTQHPMSGVTAKAK